MSDPGYLDPSCTQQRGSRIRQNTRVARRSSDTLTGNETGLRVGGVLRTR